MNYSRPRVSGGAGSDLSRLVEKAEGIRSDYDRKILDTGDELIALRKWAVDMICSLKDPEESAVMMACFLEGKSNKQAAHDIGYSRSAFFQIKRMAIKHFNELPAPPPCDHSHEGRT